MKTKGDELESILRSALIILAQDGVDACVSYLVTSLQNHNTPTTEEESNV